MPISTELRSAYAFHRENGGSIVGENAACAIAAARAELLLSVACDEWEAADVSWVYDDAPWDAGDVDDPAVVAARFESGEWTGPFGCVVSVSGEPMTSLWGIVLGSRGTDDPYARVVVADLAAECAAELSQAIGDAADRESLTDDPRFVIARG